jgi:hypothetical protein
MAADGTATLKDIPLNAVMDHRGDTMAKLINIEPRAKRLDLQT